MSAILPHSDPAKSALASWPCRLAPLVVTQAFLWLTLGLFAFGPWAWPLPDPAKLYLFVAGAHLALAIGYLSAIHKAPAETSADPRRWIRIGLWATVLILPLTAYARTGSWVPDVMRGLLDPGGAYADAHRFAEGGGNAASYLRILAAPALVLLFPLGIFYWARMSKGMRAVMASAMAAVVLLSIATGQRRDIADLLVTAPLLLAASHMAGITRLKRSTIVTGVATGCLALAAFTVYFGYSHVSRVGKETAAYGVNPVTKEHPNSDNAILQAFPAEFRPGVVALLNYLTTGYYGLGLAMERPSRPMYGLGHSMFLTRNAQKLANDPSFEKRSLPVQISDKDGFRYPVFWCTAYPYFANDVGFWGTLVFLFLIGRGLARTWVDMLGGKSPHAVVLFALLATLVFYLPATNRMLQDGEGVAAFYFWLAAWFLARAGFLGTLRSQPAFPAGASA
jgi:hypothetical protein